MNKSLSEELFDEEFENVLNEQNSCLDCSTEIWFYSPSDDRIWTSNVEDIDGGDNFGDYCEEFFEKLDEEEYYND